MKIDIKIPSMKARVIILIGSYEEIRKEIPFGIDKETFEGGPVFQAGGSYVARCAWRHRDCVKFPFTNVIHSKTHALSVIAHEAVHASGNILSSMGVVADWDNDEAQAYLIQHIIERVEDALNIYEGY
jgi:hypothetical protein